MRDKNEAIRLGIDIVSTAAVVAVLVQLCLGLSYLIDLDAGGLLHHFGGELLALVVWLVCERLDAKLDGGSTESGH